MKQPEVSPGTFYGVGVGPGDPELITRKAARILAEVDWIYFPAGAGSGISHGVARRIVEPLGLAEEKFRKVPLCMDRQRQSAQQGYEETATRIAADLRQGQSVAWLTEGDPLFYSTFLHLHDALRRGFPEVKIEIVPGVSSIHAAAARAGVPICRLDERVAIVPAAYGLEQLPQLLDQFATLFLVKVHSSMELLLDRLADLPGSVQAVYVEKVGTPEERVVTDLRSLRGQELSYFSLVILRGSSPPGRPARRRNT